VILETVFAVVLIVGCLVYIIFLMKEGVLKKLVPKFSLPFKRQNQKNVVEIPKEWVADKPTKQIVVAKSSSTVTMELKEYRKIRIPGLLLFKRIMAVTLMLIYFVMAQATIFYTGGNPMLYVLFILTSFLLLDYLYKTRRKEKIG